LSNAPHFPVLESLVLVLERGFRQAGAPGSGILLAVSGGADSTALLLGCVQLVEPLRLSLEVACLDHGLRPEAAEEVEAVRKLAKRFELPFHTRRLRLEVTSSAIEARARQARYEALEGLRAERGLDWVATAHTASDQAETLLMRLASLRGAAGVLPRRGRVLRPLLGCSRGEVESFLAAQGQDYARDPMNEDPAFLRVRIRRDVLPALEKAAGPAAARHLARFAALAREDEELLGALAEQARGRLAVGPGALDAVGVRALLPPLRRRVLGRLLEEQGINVDLLLLERALAALDRGGRAELAGGWELRCAGGMVRCVPSRQRPVPAPGGLTIGLGEVVQDDLSGLTFGLSRQRPAEGESFVELDASVGDSLTLRRRLPGDRLAAGPGGGSRKLKDLLMDRRVRAEERDHLPIVVDQSGNILWVVGVWSQRPRTPAGLYVFARPS